jgi:hypothetical protein
MVSGYGHSDDTQTTPKKKLTDRQAILKGFSNIICEQGEKGVGTGADRLRRWTERNPAPGGRISQIDGVEAPEILLMQQQLLMQLQNE